MILYNSPRLPFISFRSPKLSCQTLPMTVNSTLTVIHCVIRLIIQFHPLFDIACPGKRVGRWVTEEQWHSCALWCQVPAGTQSLPSVCLFWQALGQARAAARESHRMGLLFQSHTKQHPPLPQHKHQRTHTSINLHIKNQAKGKRTVVCQKQSCHCHWHCQSNNMQLSVRMHMPRTVRIKDEHLQLCWSLAERGNSMLHCTAQSRGIWFISYKCRTQQPLLSKISQHWATSTSAWPYLFLLLRTLCY